MVGNYSISVLYSTFSTLQDAKDCARKCLENELVKCVNIIPSSTSIYKWEGKIHEDQEVIAIFKTSSNLINQLKDFVIKEHPYDNPAIMIFNPETSEEFYNYLNSFNDISLN